MKFGLRELLFTGVLVAMLACSFLVFRQANQKREQRMADIDSKVKALEHLRSATAGIDDLNRKVAELEQAITFFESRLPAEKEIDKILKEVWQLAEANSLETRTIKTQRAEKSAHYSEQPIVLNFAGDFNGFYAFLLQLEKLPRITRIHQMNLQKISDREGEMQAQMTLCIFFEPDGRGSVAGAN